jgi:hypothetical protein
MIIEFIIALANHATFSLLPFVSLSLWPLVALIKLNLQKKKE